MRIATKTCVLSLTQMNADTFHAYVKFGPGCGSYPTAPFKVFADDHEAVSLDRY